MGKSSRFGGREFLGILTKKGLAKLQKQATISWKTLEKHNKESDAGHYEGRGSVPGDWTK